MPAKWGKGSALGIRRSDFYVWLYKYSKTSWFGYDTLEIGSILHAAPVLNQGWVKKFYLPGGGRKDVEKGVGPVRKWPATLS